MKRANAILEYGILLFIVVGALATIHHFMIRHIQSRVRDEVDRDLREPIKFLWDVQFTSSKQNTVMDAYLYIGDKYSNDGETEADFTTLVPPTPPYINVAGLHVQDAAQPAPGQQNPQDSQSSNEDRTNPER